MWVDFCFWRISVLVDTKKYPLIFCNHYFHLTMYFLVVSSVMFFFFFKWIHNWWSFCVQSSLKFKSKRDTLEMGVSLTSLINFWELRITNVILINYTFSNYYLAFSTKEFKCILFSTVIMIILLCTSSGTTRTYSIVN